MNKGIANCALAALLATTSVALGQESPPAKPAEAERTPGKRLRVEFRETRQRGETTTATRSYVLLLHADAEPARVFVGPVVAMTTSEQGTLTTQFKDAGVSAQASARTLSDGGYRLDAQFEDSSPLGSGGGVTDIRAADNPILRVVKGKSRLSLREGQTLPFVGTVDPVSGEVVRVDVTVTAAPAPTPASAPGGTAANLRARLVLVRHHGATTAARRPYSVVLDTSGEETSEAEAFGGSMLPVQTPVQGHPTVMLKDIGAGLQVTATRRASDGRFRLDLRFSDGVLSAAEGSPRMQMFESDSQIFVHVGETVTVASAVDPQTGEIVEAEVSLEGAR
jgi:hypothetical protein